MRLDVLESKEILESTESTENIESKDVIAIDVLHANDQFAVIYKPEGVSLQGESNSLLFRIGEQLGVEQVFPVHRLDKVTSGVVVVALNSESASVLSQQFQNREVEKHYLAITDAKPVKKQGLIKGDIEKSRRGAWKLSRSFNNPSMTQFFSRAISPGKRVFILKPHTGKTHQLRVSLKSLGSPILGDALYAGSPSDRTYLHAYSLGFYWAGEWLRFSAKPTSGREFLSTDFNVGLEAYATPWLLKWPSLST